MYPYILVAREKMESNIQEDVIRRLPLLNEDCLLSTCEVIELSVPEKIKTKGKSSILRFLLRHLNSEEVEESRDEGLAIYQQLQKLLVTTFEVSPTKDSRISFGGDLPYSRNSLENETYNRNEIDFNDEEKSTFHKIKEFRIQGTIGKTNQPDNLHHISSLNHGTSSLMFLARLALFPFVLNIA